MTYLNDFELIVLYQGIYKLFHYINNKYYYKINYKYNTLYNYMVI